MKIKSFNEIKTFAWFLTLSIIPVSSIIRNNSGWLLYSIMEILIVGFILWTIMQNRGKSILYDSDDESIYIAGLKEGIYDPDRIVIREIDNVIEEKGSIRIELKTKKIIRLINIGKKQRMMILEDIENKISSIKNLS